jgi:hypothetical protein
MESWEEYQASQRSYTEMLAEAQKIHPDMKVRLTEFDENSWEMYMPTAFIEKYELSEEFKDTPAWEMYKERDSGHDNSLQRYRHKCGMDRVPLEGVAEYVNLNQEEQVWGIAVLNKLLKDNGIVIDWDNITKETASKYGKFRKEASVLANTEFESKRQALKDKYGI